MSSSLHAIAWAATRAGESYGTFIIGLTPKERERIKEEYKSFLEKRAQEAEARAKKSKATLPKRKPPINTRKKILCPMPYPPLRTIENSNIKSIGSDYQ